MRTESRGWCTLVLCIALAACGTTDGSARGEPAPDTGAGDDSGVDVGGTDDTGGDDPDDVGDDTGDDDTGDATDAPADAPMPDVTVDTEPDTACRPTAERSHVCDDGSEVPWCTCTTAGEWACIDTPETQCGDTGGCTPGPIQNHVCPDGREVPWCECREDGSFTCLAEPEQECLGYPCNDGSVLACEIEMPLCETGTTPAVVDGCWVCLDPLSCGEPQLCETDADCPNEMWCNPCGTSSCPGCPDCVSACSTHGCGTEPEPLCDAVRPECGEGAVAVVRDGCWECVGLDSCSPVDRTCTSDVECGLGELCQGEECVDTGCISDPEGSVTCFALRPVCDEGSVAIARGGCWDCVEIATCDRFGGPCESDDECPAGGWCGCPDGLDCFADSCVESNCATETWATCRALRPDCGDSGVAIVIDGCWECVDRTTCEAL